MREAEQAFREMIEMGGRLPQYWGNVGASFCYHCNLLIAHQDQLEDQLATFFSTVNPAIIGNFYEVIGTVDRSELKHGKQDQFLMHEMLEYLHDFKEVVTYEPVGV